MFLLFCLYNTYFQFIFPPFQCFLLVQIEIFTKKLFDLVKKASLCMKSHRKKYTNSVLTLRPSKTRHSVGTNTLGVNHGALVKKTWCQFHQRSTYSFYARRFLKRKKILRIWLNSYAFRIYVSKSCTYNVDEIEPWCTK